MHSERNTIMYASFIIGINKDKKSDKDAIRKILLKGKKSHEKQHIYLKRETFLQKMMIMKIYVARKYSIINLFSHEYFINLI